MTWLLTWLTVSVATLNATLHLLVIYKFVAYNFFSKLSFTNVKFSHIHFVVFMGADNRTEALLEGSA